jgi:hypothetical protein
MSEKVLLTNTILEGDEKWRRHFNTSKVLIPCALSDSGDYTCVRLAGEVYIPGEQPARRVDHSSEQFVNQTASISTKFYRWTQEFGYWLLNLRVLHQCTLFPVRHWTNQLRSSPERLGGSAWETAIPSGVLFVPAEWTIGRMGTDVYRYIIIGDLIQRVRPDTDQGESVSDQLEEMLKGFMKKYTQEDRTRIYCLICAIACTRVEEKGFLSYWSLSEILRVFSDGGMNA